MKKFRGCITKLSFAGKLLRLDGSLAWPKPITQAISLEKFHGTNRSVKTVKLFHLKWFAIYGMQSRGRQRGLISWEENFLWRTLKMMGALVPPFCCLAMTIHMLRGNKQIWRVKYLYIYKGSYNLSGLLAF